MLDEASVSDLGVLVPSLYQTGSLLPQKFDGAYFPFDPGTSSRERLPTKHVLQICSAGIVLSMGTGDGGTREKEISPWLYQDTEEKLMGLFYQPLSLNVSRTELATRPWREGTPYLGDIWDEM